MLDLTDYLTAGDTTISNLLLKNYSRLGLSTDEFMLWIQLFSASQAGDKFPELSLIAQAMGKSVEAIYAMLDSLEEQGFLKIETSKNQQGQQTDHYNLLPIFTKLADLKQLDEYQKQTVSEEQAIKELFQMIEQEFGRSLTSIEYQEIGYWLNDDGYSPELIKLALREAVLNQAYNFRYMKQILLNWEKKNITTKQQVAEEKKRRDQLIMQKEEKGTKELPKVSLYNWLDQGGESDAE